MSAGSGDRTDVGELGDIEAGAGHQDRAAPRTNLLLAASAEIGGRSLPVRIRNLSETGAMIEGAGLPDAGMPLILKRGDLEVAATVAWAAGGRRGVRFAGPTPVSEWTGGKPRPIDCTGLRDQRRVDAIQAEARSSPLPGRALRAPEAPPAPPPLSPDLDKRLADELGYVQRLLEGLGDELIADLLLIQRHGRSLQSLDLVGQILGHVSAILRADDKAAVVEEIGMEDLRARLKRKAIG
ncbi:MAG TPA: PilZ domain-containing protein [Allosphingosinicella sp.]|nr:PilZ domain-containing protein [Allosphingosinicella sp.]